MPAGTQLQIDFTRGEQLGLIRVAVLPAYTARDGGQVSPVFLKSVLRTIDDHGGGRTCWLKAETIAAEVGCRPRQEGGPPPTRQVKRAIEGLQACSLICVERKKTQAGITCNHYTVVWTELAVLCPENRRAVPGGREMTGHGQQVDRATRRRIQATDQSAIEDDQSAIEDDQSAIAGTSRSASWKRLKETPPPSPATATATVGTRSDDTGHDWAGVEDALRTERIGAIRIVIECAKREGLSPEQFRVDVLDVFVANRPLFRSAGAIVERMRHGEWPAEGVVAPRALHEARVAKEEAAAKRAEEHRAAVAERDAWRAEYQALDAAYGEELDGLETHELRELARLTWSEGSFDFQWGRFRRRPEDGFERYQLLLAIFERRAE